METPDATRNNDWKKLKLVVEGTEDMTISNNPRELCDVNITTIEDIGSSISNVAYLYKGYIPFAMVTGIIAEPGVGKSSLALWLAKTITTGGKWFNGTLGPKEPRHVMWCGTENDTGITIKRCRDWGIPGNKILLPFGDNDFESINLFRQDHVDKLEAGVQKYKPLMVVVDSLRGSHDLDENSSQVSTIVKNLAGIAERTNVAVLVLHHTKKISLDERMTANSCRGSNSIFAMMRVMYGIDKPDKSSNWCRVKLLKDNLGISPKPFGFRVTSTGLEFGDVPKKVRSDRIVDKVNDWLKAYMIVGVWYDTATLEADALAEGISIATLKRAKKELGIEGNYTRKLRKVWQCQMPPASFASSSPEKVTEGSDVCSPS